MTAEDHDRGVQPAISMTGMRVTNHKLEINKEPASSQQTDTPEDVSTLTGDGDLTTSTAGPMKCAFQGEVDVDPAKLHTGLL